MQEYQKQEDPASEPSKEQVQALIEQLERRTASPPSAEKQEKETDVQPPAKPAVKITFEIGDQREPEESAVARREREGWKLANVLRNAASVTLACCGERDVAVVTLGNCLLVFERNAPPAGGTAAS